jgi:hypothetical protein
MAGRDVLSAETGERALPCPQESARLLRAQKNQFGKSLFTENNAGVIMEMVLERSGSDEV